MTPPHPSTHPSGHLRHNIYSKQANSLNWLSPFQQLAEIFSGIGRIFYLFYGWKNWAGHGNTGIYAPQLRLISPGGCVVW